MSLCRSHVLVGLVASAVVAMAAEAPVATLRCGEELSFRAVKVVRRQDGGLTFAALNKNAEGLVTESFALHTPPPDANGRAEFKLNVLGSGGHGTLHVDLHRAGKTRRFAPVDPDGDADAVNGTALLERHDGSWQVTVRTPLWQLGKVKRGETRPRVDAELRFSGVR
ncbi:MAG: hypothetical protein IT204_08505 [Fimbriimonadaceae bacterium]|nr:hypothetical protein [Fimbriimonadaceae bacterium]